MNFTTGQRTVTGTFPRGGTAVSCHIPEASFALGTETAQMNRVVGRDNQIDKLAAHGRLRRARSQTLQGGAGDADALAGRQPAASATIEQRATSYLHANCGFCHRPADDIDCVTDPCQDLRFGLPLAVRNLCNTMPSKGDLGVDGAKNLVPGAPRQILDVGPHDQAPDDGGGKQAGCRSSRSYVVDQTGRRPDRPSGSRRSTPAHRRRRSFFMTPARRRCDEPGTRLPRGDCSARKLALVLAGLPARRPWVKAPGMPQAHRRPFPAATIRPLTAIGEVHF